MKKIVYTISTLKRSGPVLVLYGIIKNLDKSKFKPLIITLSEEIKDSMQKEFQDLNVTIISLNLSRLESLFLGGCKLKKIVKKIQPSVIHANSFRDILFVAMFLRNYRKIVSLHCNFFEDYHLKYGRTIGKIMASLQKYAIKKFDCNICVSEILAEILTKYLPKLKFEYVNNGVDTDKFCPIENKNDIRKKLKLPLDKKIFIWCGSFTPRKNPIILIEAIEYLDRKDCFFIFCGARGKLLEIAKEKTNKNPNILFTGYIENIYKYLQASDFYISTSLSEGFHLSVYEAMACGVPVILPQIEVYNKIFENSMAFGYCLSDKKDLIKCLESSLRVDCEMLKDSSANFVKTYFSVQSMTKNYQKFYEDI